MMCINDCGVIRSVLSRKGPGQITCYDNGEDAAYPEATGGKL